MADTYKLGKLVRQLTSLADGGVTISNDTIPDDAIDNDKINVTNPGADSGYVLSLNSDGSFTWVENSGGGGGGSEGPGYTSASYDPDTGQVTFVGTGGNTTVVTGDLRGEDGTDGSDGAAGAGYTGGVYDSDTGVVTFTGTGGNNDFSTDDLRGSDGAAGTNGVGISSITKSGSTVTVTYTDNSTDTFTVNDGADGADGAGYTGATYDSATGTVTFTGTGGNADVTTGDLRGTDGSATLAGDTDTNIDDPQDNEFLRYDGTHWVNEAVTIPSAANNATITLTTSSSGISLDTDASFTTDQSSDESISIDLSNDVVVNAAVNNHTLTLTKEDGTEVTFTATGSGGETDNSRLGLSLSPTSAGQTDDETITVTATLSLQDALSGETIKDGSRHVVVTDQDGHHLTVTQDADDDNVFTFVVDRGTAGTVHVSAQATFVKSDNTEAVHSASATFRVIAEAEHWYTALSTTQPTAVSSMTDEGVYNSPEEKEYVSGGNSGDDRRYAYVALPTGNYDIKTGLLFASTTDLGVISTHFTLYRLDDFNDTFDSSNNLFFEFTEA